MQMHNRILEHGKHDQNQINEKKCLDPNRPNCLETNSPQEYRLNLN